MENGKFWKTVGAVAFGVLIASALAYGARLWLVNQALKEMTTTITNTTNQMAESARLQAEKARREQEAQKARTILLDLQRKREEAERLQAQYAAQQAASDAVRTKEDAWKSYYKRPSHCDQAVGNAFVECGNHHIRAKRKFEELYEAGKL